MKNLKEFINGLSKNRKNIVLISALVIIGTIFIIEELAFPRICIKNIKTVYEYNEFMNEKIKLSSSLFVPKKETVWNMNGYDFAQGKEHGGFPVVIGENTLKITNGDLEKIYTFTITNNEQTALVITSDEYKLDADYIDYDGDGIPNIKEKELGLATYTNDSDGDGLLDNVELIMGLDPTKKDNYNDIREYKVVQDNSKNMQNYLIISGKGNIANTFLDTAELNVGFNSDFVKSDILNIVTSNEEKPENMMLYMKKKSNMNTDKYSIYSFDEYEGNLEKLETNVSGDYLTANISIFNNFYFIGNNAAVPNGKYTNQIMILLDNSGSMYSAEYVAEKSKIEITEDELDGFGNDVDFKRLSLMTSLVDRLGNEKFEYSVYAFTRDFYNIIEDSKDINEIKEGINSLKTDYQNFNGTELSGAIRKYVSEFEDNFYGKKYMIVLTDGVDSGWFTYKVSDSSLSNYKKDGINIITIGLGLGVNSEYLMNIAAKTNGKYLYASDANMLETLIELIESGIENQGTTVIAGKDVTLIADSGFDVARDGFSFENFGSIGGGSEGGNCYGFAQLSKAIYLNQLKESDKEDKHFMNEEWNLMEYTLTPKNKERLVKGNVYNIKLNETYQSLLYTNFNENDDYRYIGEDGIPYISDKYKKIANGTGFEPYIKIVGEMVTDTIAGKEVTFDRYESLGQIHLDRTDISEENKDDYQLLQLIHRYFLLQSHHMLDLILEHGEKNSQNSKYDFEKEINQMISELKTGAPALLSINCELGGHSILATKAYKSNDLEKYFVGVYDSNIPGREAMIVLERQTSYDKDRDTSYYSFKYEDDVYTNYRWSSMMYSGAY